MTEAKAKKKVDICKREPRDMGFLVASDVLSYAPFKENRRRKPHDVAGNHDIEPNWLSGGLSSPRDDTIRMALSSSVHGRRFDGVRLS